MQDYRSGYALPPNIIALRLEVKETEDVVRALGELADAGVVTHRLLGPYGPGFYMPSGKPGAM
ncbi:hypothetical protein [Streptomyces sp. NPDC002403]